MTEQTPAYRIGFRIKGFDTFEITVHDMRTGLQVSELVYNASDFPDGIDLDSHLLDFEMTADGHLIPLRQQ